jgi:hypothetical protein
MPRTPKSTVSIESSIPRRERLRRKAITMPDSSGAGQSEPFRFVEILPVRERLVHDTLDPLSRYKKRGGRDQKDEGDDEYCGPARMDDGEARKEKKIPTYLKISRRRARTRTRENDYDGSPEMFLVQRSILFLVSSSVLAFSATRRTPVRRSGTRRTSQTGMPRRKPDQGG